MSYNLPQLNSLVEEKIEYDNILALLQSVSTADNSHFNFTLAGSTGTSIAVSADIMALLNWDIAEIAQVVRNMIVTKINAELAQQRADFLALGFDVTQLT